MMAAYDLNSDFLGYLIDQGIPPGERVPTLSELSVFLGISVGKLREQFEAARQLGLVSARPRIGIRREPYSFYSTIRAGLLFGLASSEVSFEQLSELRQNIERSMWYEAVTRLTADDLDLLQKLVELAWQKLREQPVHIPTDEHRQLHLTIFCRIDNPLVVGILEAYWDAYDNIQLTRFADYQYWIDVWTYHEQIVDAIVASEYEVARDFLQDHFKLLPKSPLGSGESA